MKSLTELLAEWDKARTPQMAKVSAEVLEAIRRHTPDGAQSGIGNYYFVRLGGTEGLPHYARLIAKALVDNPPDVDVILEAGAGLAELPFLLSAEGFSTCAIERNPYCFKAIEDLRGKLSAIYPDFADRARAYFGVFPCDIEGVDPARTMLISTCLMFTSTQEQEDRHIEGMMGYHSIIVDVARLVRFRPHPKDWPAIERLFLDAGYREVRVIQEYTSARLGDGGGKVIWYEKA